MITNQNDGPAALSALTIALPAAGCLPKGLDYYVHEIGSRWYKMTDGILDVADLCAEAVRTLCPEDRKNLRGCLGFSKGTMSKLVQISRNGRLRDDQVRKYLPPNYTILYEIAKLSDALLFAAIADGVIRIDMHREDLTGWLPKGQKPKPEILFTLFGLDDISEGRLVVFQERLRKALLDFPEIEAQSKDKQWTFRSFRSVPLADAA